METVVLVERDEVLREIFASYLGDRFDVRAAESAAAALGLLDPDLHAVVLNHRRAVDTAGTVLRERRERGLDCRVVVYSGVEPPPPAVASRADEYLVLPVAPPELVAAVAGD